MTIIKGTIFASLLLYAAISDIRKREVSDTVPIMIAITALIGITSTDLPEMFIAALVIAVPQLVVALMKPGGYGGADIKIMTACAFLLGLWRGVLAIITGLTAGLLITVISRLIERKKINEPFPLVPYLAAGKYFCILDIKEESPHMKNRTIIGILCIALAVAVMFGITPLVNSVSSGKIEVLQVVRRIEPGQRITDEDIIKVQIGSFGVKDTAIKDENQLIGKYASVTIMPNNCIYPDMIGDQNDSAEYVLQQLNGSQMAISITISSFANGLSGKLQNGDIVSAVIVSENETTIPVELTYLRVITTTTAKGRDHDQLTTNEDGTTDLPATATLMVTPAQAKLLALHDRKSHIYLTLVYRGDPETAQKFLDAQNAVLTKVGDEHE